jgi:Tfp pilus assembly protein PilX
MKKQRSPRSPLPAGRSGFVALVIVLGLLLLLAILAFAFHFFGMDAHREMNRAYLGERALTIAQSAIDEAVADFQAKISHLDPAETPKRQLYSIIRTMTPTEPYAYTFQPKLTTQVADVPPEVSTVRVTVQRFTSGVQETELATGTKIPEDVARRIRAGWEEFYRTGICGPDMDLIFEVASHSKGEQAVGFADFRVTTTLPADSSPIVRDLEVRRAFSHSRHDMGDYTQILKELGIKPPNKGSDSSLDGGVAGFSPVPVGSSPPAAPTSTSGTSSSTGGDDSVFADVHLSPYDDLRIVRRRDDAGW